jgi:hypothetical protein
MSKGNKIKDIIAAVAPTVATALGGPLAGVATRAIAGKILGRDDATFDEVEAAVTAASGADLVKLKELEYEFKAQLKDADIQLEKISADDRASARDRQARMKDWTPSILGLAIIIGFFGVLAYIFRFGLPDQGSEVLLIMVGALGTMTSQVGNFFFGSSAGSKTKDAVIAELKGSAP